MERDGGRAPHPPPARAGMGPSIPHRQQDGAGGTVGPGRAEVRSRLSPWQCPQGGAWSPGRDNRGVPVTRLQGRALHVLLALSPALRAVRGPPGTWCVPVPSLRLSRSRGNVTPSPAGIRAGYNGPGVTAPSRLRLLRAWPGCARGSSFK